MDVEMADGLSQENFSTLDKMDLIKTVRGLDQNGPGEDGKNLEKLWKSLNVSANSQFHAAEESSLRWLLKSMNGSSKDAETLRRWPLTWAILECVFQRIPLFSLAKSLADRRFISVLQQTLKDISEPATESSSSPSKRKRSTTKSFNLDALRDTEGCLLAGDALFGALKTLLDRLDSSATQSSHDKIGAEHIRSLFCTSAADAAIFTSLSLTLCNVALTSGEEQEGWESWIETITAIWDLHLLGNDDVLEVAANLFAPSAAILSKLEGISGSQEIVTRETLRTKWTTDLENLMHNNFILPARAVFINRQDLEPITRALHAAANNLHVAAPAMYFLASSVTDSLSEGRLRKGNIDWMKQMFKVVEGSLRDRENRDKLVLVVLKRAAEKSMSIDTDDLRSVCREYALQEETTNWHLIAVIAGCDFDVFKLPEGAGLLETVCERSISSEFRQDDFESFTKIIQAIAQVYRTGRDFAGFLKLWYQELCKLEKQKCKNSSPWLQYGQKQHGDSFETLIEKEMSPQQLLEVLEWVKGEKLHSRALCLFLDSIAQGIRGETYVDAVGSKLFDLVSQVKKSSSTLTTLKWGVVSKTISWVTPESRAEIWGSIQGQLTKILSEAPLESGETYEAFKCCCQTWISMSPDDAHISEPASLVDAFTTRLSSNLLSPKSLKGKDLSSFLQQDPTPAFLEEAAPEHYLAWFLRGSGRLSQFVYGTKAVLPQALQNALLLPSSEVALLRDIWACLLENENNVNTVKVAGDLVDRLIKSLEEDGKEKRWPAEGSQTWIRSLSSTHTDAFTRRQRERIMVLLNAHRAKTTKRVSLEGWRYILGLSTKLMGRATFYEGMAFSHLVDVADAMSGISSSTPTQDGTLTDLIEAYYKMATATIRQMAEHLDERSTKYFDESRNFVSDCEDAGDLSPFRLTLLKALITEVAKSPNFTGHVELGSLSDAAKDVLGKCVLAATGYFLTEKKAFESHIVIADLRLFAAVDAAESLETLSGASKLKQSDVRKAERRSHAAMASGDLRGWKVQTFLRTYFSSLLEEARPTTFYSISQVPQELQVPFFQSSVASVTKEMNTAAKMEYLRDLIGVFVHGLDTDGQASAIHTVVDQLLACPDLHGKGSGFDLAAAHSELTSTLLTLKSQSVCTRVCRILCALLEKKPQSMSQWNIELVLNTISGLSLSTKAFDEQIPNEGVPFALLCNLMEAIIKKHRLRLEGHHHLLLSTMQALLRNLIINHNTTDALGQTSHETKAHRYARLVTLICEPTAGAVSRSQHQSALDSATDAAKRSAGRHMYLVMMQYVKLQLEADVPRQVREALEPAMNSIFDITPPEVRKILNDAMDGSGRAIVKEMFKSYTKFGKWSGV
ncbi:Nucleolar pre-ribosomal-associated protein 2 [Fusarium austroafricanum]|uniref:Nucleolar pre-ribosomal-associated protein 2 n=1 Tax=Fusarium austroafricanum TaxID=2364996 RepID=A0A8H4NZY1_9HYPO|nr:Nucleolar pre-ribosomal-associated protein 2 [Fusarium austroafricanum]